MAKGEKPKPFIKDPNAVMDFGVDWSNWLGVDTLSTSAWSITTTATSPALVIDSDVSNTTVATVWLSGGKVGTKYALLNRVTTAGGRTNDRTIYVQVKEL